MDLARAAKKSFLAHADPLAATEPARLYTRMISSLERVTSPESLGTLFGDIRAAGLRDRLPLEDGEVRRLFARLGLLPPGAPAETAVKLAEEFVRRAAESVSRTPAQVSLALRLFAGGQPGFLASGICAAMPRCSLCDLTRECAFHNEPPRPLNERITPLKRLARDGADALSDLEALALLFSGSRAGEADLERARSILNRYGTLRGILAAPFAELAGLRDMTESSAARLAAAAALQQRALDERRIAGPPIRSAADLYDLFHARLRDLRHEVFMIVILDGRHRVIRAQRVAEGATPGAQVEPGAVFAPVLREGAPAVALLHNHPSGDTRPSEADRHLTRRLKATADLLEVRLLDHVIVGEGAFTSFVDLGEIEPFAPKAD